MTISFRPIAQVLSRTVHPSPRIDLSAAKAILLTMSQGKQEQGVLLTANHYSGPDFRSWWFVILISAVMPVHVHWITSAGWTNSGWLTGFTHWLFPRGARILGFTPMPAMPPDPNETESRAIAVRQVLHYAAHTPNPVVGLTPEGGDFSDGVLGALPSGVGRFIELLSRYCQLILPVGVWKEVGRINLIFGSPYRLDVPADLSAHERDQHIGTIVMQHIAELIPERLRGVYK